MNDSANGFGQRIFRLRRRKRLSQRQLGEKVGLSQASVSRLESESSPPEDLRLLSRMAQALDLTLSDLMDGFPFSVTAYEDEEGHFHAFCPNPLCDRNVRERKEDGTLSVTWRSSERHPGNVFDEVNFCSKCGEELIKECPSCKRRLRAPGARFCVTCGTRLSNRPTKQEWQQIEKMLPAKPVLSSGDDDDDDLPF